MINAKFLLFRHQQRGGVFGLTQNLEILPGKTLLKSQGANIEKQTTKCSMLDLARFILRIWQHITGNLLRKRTSQQTLQVKLLHEP